VIGFFTGPLHVAFDIDKPMAALLQLVASEANGFLAIAELETILRK